MRALTKQEILQAKDQKAEEVLTPEWAPEDASEEERANCGVLVRGMTGKERDRMEAAISTQDKKGRTKVDLEDYRARVCALCICDPKFQRIFSDQEIAALSEKSAAPIDRIYDVAARLSGIRKADMEEAAKN